MAQEGMGHVLIKNGLRSACNPCLSRDWYGQGLIMKLSCDRCVFFCGRNTLNDQFNPFCLRCKDVCQQARGDRNHESLECLRFPLGGSELHGKIA